MKLPGDVDKNSYIEELIRVNHAGEYGAKMIYEGQLSVLRGREHETLIKKMADQEKAHLEYFENQMVTRKVRPSILMPLWHIAGYALGAVGAKISPKAAMLCTEAIEEVICDHYSDQVKKLDDSERDLKNKIEQFKNEEAEHRDIAIDNKSQETLGYKIFATTIRLFCKLSIEIAKKY